METLGPRREGTFPGSLGNCWLWKRQPSLKKLKEVLGRQDVNVSTKVLCGKVGDGAKNSPAPKEEHRNPFLLGSGDAECHLGSRLASQ